MSSVLVASLLAIMVPTSPVSSDHVISLVLTTIHGLFRYPAPVTIVTMHKKKMATAVGSESLEDITVKHV